MTHDIPDHVLNSDIVYCISEYVRNIEHRNILLDWWFYGYTLEGLAEKYHRSLTGIKNVIYGIGDEILIKASKRSKQKLPKQ